MGLHELWTKMSQAELLLWQAYFKVKEEDRLKAEAE